MNTTTKRKPPLKQDENDHRQNSSRIAKGMSDREWIQGIVQMEIDYQLYRYQRNRTLILAGFLVFMTFLLLPEIFQFLALLQRG